MGFFACGQFFPKQQRLVFTMTDTGIGFREHMAKYTKKRLEAHEAIRWALTGENTARLRSEGKSGGLGLKLIKEFIEKNHGRMYIVSDRGYFERLQSGHDRYQRLDVGFPGTIVTLDIDTSDEHVYDEKAFAVEACDIF